MIPILRLADKSLVVIDFDAERSIIRQYEIVRDYVRERAADPSNDPADMEATRTRHADRFSGRANQIA